VQAFGLLDLPYLHYAAALAAAGGVAGYDELIAYLLHLRISKHILIPNLTREASAKAGEAPICR
jgi:hypothetical protein